VTKLSDVQAWMAEMLQLDRALPRDPKISEDAKNYATGNDRLSPVEQVEIYREQFWLRHTSSLVEDFEGLSGHLHAYKVDIAKAMLDMCHALGSRVLLCCSSTSSHATSDAAALIKDLQKLAMLAVPYGIRIAYEALSWGRHVNEYTQAWDLVAEADRSNLGLAIDSFHILATGTSAERLEEVVAGKIVLVQLADFMWREIRSREERIDTARHFRVFPGEGVHSAEVAKLVRTLDDLGYRGDYSFEVFNDDYTQLPHAVVAERARRSVKWLTDQVSRRSLPLRGAAR